MGASGTHKGPADEDDIAKVRRESESSATPPNEAHPVVDVYRHGHARDECEGVDIEGLYRKAASVNAYAKILP